VRMPGMCLADPATGSATPPTSWQIDPPHLLLWPPVAVVGNAMLRGISGGQKKRVTTGKTGKQGGQQEGVCSTGQTLLLASATLQAFHLPVPSCNIHVPARLPACLPGCRGDGGGPHPGTVCG
jgi:hypothetical protein